MSRQDPRRFMFSSDYPIAYFVYNNNQTLVLPNGRREETRIPHNLPFIPMVLGFWSDSSDFASYHNFGENPEGDYYYGVSINVEADGSDIIVEWENNSNEYQTVYLKIWGYMPPDVYDEASSVLDDTNFMFDSDFPYLEIAQYGAIPYGTATFVKHDLGYVPMCRIWRKYKYNGNTLIKPEYQSLLEPDENSGGPYVDDEQLKLGALYSNTICHYYHIYTSEG